MTLCSLSFCRRHPDVKKVWTSRKPLLWKRFSTVRMTLVCLITTVLKISLWWLVDKVQFHPFFSLFQVLKMSRQVKIKWPMKFPSSCQLPNNALDLEHINVSAPYWISNCRPGIRFGLYCSHRVPRANRHSHCGPSSVTVYASVPLSSRISETETPRIVFPQHPGQNTNIRR